MAKQANNRTAGFSLIEVMVAILILGLAVVPVCSSIITTYRINARGDALLKTQLAVSSKVEELMATGLSGPVNETEDNITVVAVRARNADEDLPYYEVTVTGVMPNGSDNITVNTFIRHVEEAGP